VSSGACDGKSPVLWARLAGAFLLFACAFALSQTAGAKDLIEPEILSRDAWGALPAKTELMQEQKPGEIIIHHTGERQQPKVSLEAKMRGLQNFSMKAGRVGTLSKPAWGDVLYHYYIDVAGKIAEGRDVSFAGDATTGFDNDGRIQITVEGDFEREEPNPEQLASLTRLVVWLAVRYGIAPESISGHGDHDQTDCPGKNLKPFLEDLRKGAQAEIDIDDK
jgi:hypothetical protein